MKVKGRSGTGAVNEVRQSGRVSGSSTEVPHTLFYPCHLVLYEAHSKCATNMCMDGWMSF